MTIKFKNVVVVARPSKPDTARILTGLIKYLQTKKVNIALEHDTANIFSQHKLPIISHDRLKHHCDLIMVIGGDGSLLSTARIAALQNLPILGINRGSLGFLTDITPNNITKIGEILAGNYIEEHRMLLASKMENNNKILTNNLALNDVVLLGHNSGHMIEFAVYVDQQFLCNYRADGLIIATPTGSTAHALSSGGPILYPTLDNIVLVPMLSHNLSSRPIVIENKSRIKIIFNKNKKTDLLILCDGQTQTLLQEGTIKISKAKEKLRLIHPIDYDYFETLRTKLNWEKRI